MSATLPRSGVDRGPEILAIIWTFTTLALVVVSLKIFTRYKIVHDTGLDDFLVFLSMVLALVCTSIFTADVKLGMGKPMADLDPQHQMDAVRMNIIGTPFGVVAYSLPNVSVAIFINRILMPKRWRKVLLYAITILQCVISGISCVLLFVQCSPVEALWNPTIPATCMSLDIMIGYSYFVGSYVALTDIILAIVPAAAFWRLKLKAKTTIGLCLLMGMTTIAAICTIIRTTKLNELADLADFTYGTVDLVIWEIVEANVMIISACIPSLKPFVISVSSSVGKGKSKSRFQRDRHRKHGNGNSIMLRERSPSSSNDPLHVHGNQDLSKTLGTRGSATPIDQIKRTTKIAVEWQDV